MNKKKILTIQMTVEMEVPDKFLPLKSDVDLQSLFVAFHAGRTKIIDFKILK